MSRVVAALRRHATLVSVTLLAALAYLPALTAAPGRMPADSKLYVYLDPARFISDTTTSFDPRLYAGWVPHQHIAYLWPTGPWYWLFERIGAPDWIAHRLWIGTLLLAAGGGVFWMCRRFAYAPLAALAAAAVYQLSPFILPYVSRTSVLLLPFAGLGWIVGCTAIAARRGRWRYPAFVALIVLSVGAVNATALLMIVPAPVLWLLHAAWSRVITWRRATVTALRIAVMSVAVSLWWAAMLVIQGRNGADVLAYSESLESVSFTSTSTEVGRGLGYWLFYVRDGFAATTTASIDHLVSVRVIVAGFLLSAVCLLGIVAVRNPYRRFAGLLVATGVVLGVGVHPIDDPSPLMDLLVGDGQGGLALALRSSTRAVPVLLLGLALGAASLVTAARLPRRLAPTLPPAVLRASAAAAVVVLAVVNLPALRNGGFVDPALERDQDPPAHWSDAAEALDARTDGFRVLQVPGTEFGAFDWGYTVDQPLASLSERPVVTRDLLPLGSPAAMDLAFALDDRMQEGTFEPASIAPVARLLGVDTLWVAGDVAFDRFGSARPDVFTAQVTGDVDGLATSTPYGPVEPVTTDVPMVDAESLGDPRAGAPIAPITLVDVDAAVPTGRVKDTTVVVVGSGDGLVDAAAAGLIDGSEAIVYAASPPPAAVPIDRIVITDSNRRRAHHWRSSQDVHGYTEAADEGSGVLRFEPADQRLPVFGDPSADVQTVSIQEGSVTARASAYGEPFAYRPEHRPVMAIDGDPSTAWLVADRSPADGEFIELTVDGGLDHLEVRQPGTPVGSRSISRVAVAVDGADLGTHDLGDESFIGSGQRIDLPAVDTGPTVVRITIVATTAPQPPIADAIGAVGFAEIGTGHAPTVEWIRTPSLDKGAADRLDVSADVPIDVVLTRLRTEGTDRWRDDPEPVLRRTFDLPRTVDADLEVTVRLDPRVESAVLAELLGEPAVETARLTGVPAARGASAFDGDPATAWTTPFVDPVGAAVTWRGTGTASSIGIDQVAGDHSRVTSLRLTDAAGPVDVAVPADATSVELPRPVDLAELRIEIVEVDPAVTIDRRYAEPFVLPAAIAEIRFDGRSLGVRPLRRIEVDCRDDLLSIDGAGVPLRWSADLDELLSGAPIVAEPCDDAALPLEAGPHRVEGSDADATSGFVVDRLVLRDTIEAASGAAGASSIDPTEPVVVESSRRARTFEVPPCPRGCWVVLGEGYNTGWAASVDGDDLGEPVLLDGNANGWWLGPANAVRTVEARWTVQGPLTLGLAVSAFSVVALLGLIVWDRRREDDPDLAVPGRRLLSDVDLARVERPTIERHDVVTAIAGGLAAALVVGWIWGPVLALAAAAMSRLGRRPLLGGAGLAVVVAAGVVVAWVVREERPFPNAGWPVRFEWLHEWSLVGFVVIGLATVLAEPRPDDDER